MHDAERIAYLERQLTEARFQIAALEEENARLQALWIQARAGINEINAEIEKMVGKAEELSK